MQDNKKYEVLKISDVSENSWNPNVMPKKDFEWLRDSLDREWGNFKQPILVREISSWKYEIIDGAHRYRAMKELDFEDIVAVVLSLGEADARVKTIAMNKLRGVTDPIKLSELISELKKIYWMTEEEVQTLLNMEDRELEELSALTDFDMSFMDLDIVEMPIEKENVVLRLNFSKQEAEEIYRLSQITGLDVKELILKSIEEAEAFIKTSGGLKTEVVWISDPNDFDIDSLTI